MQVVEKFVSINGEGLKQGELALFIRFAGCNLRCSYCDTTYSFINPIFKEETVEEILDYAIKQNVKNITLTGGEPLLQKDIKELLIKLSKAGFKLEIETNGAVDISNFLNIDNVSFTLDYKTPSSLMEGKMILDNYQYLTKKDSVKFVCGSQKDLNKSLEIINKYNLVQKTNCLFSPVFGSLEPKNIVEFMVNNNLNDTKLSLQIHKFIWDPNKRGV